MLVDCKCKALLTVDRMTSPPLDVSSINESVEAESHTIIKA